MAASGTPVFFMVVAFGAILLCSIGICALSAALLSWLNGLPPLQHATVEGAFNKLSSTLLTGLGASLVYLVSFIFFFALMLIQKAGRSDWLGSLMGYLWIIAIVISLFYCMVTEWHPCSIMTHPQFSQMAIPGALSACRQIIALNVLFVVSFTCILVWLLASCQIDKKKPRTSTASAVQANNSNTINNNPVHDDNEVDLGELGHLLGAIDEV